MINKKEVYFPYYNKRIYLPQFPDPPFFPLLRIARGSTLILYFVFPPLKKLFHNSVFIFSFFSGKSLIDIYLLLYAIIPTLESGKTKNDHVIETQV